MPVQIGGRLDKGPQEHIGKVGLDRDAVVRDHQGDDRLEVTRVRFPHGVDDILLGLDTVTDLELLLDGQIPGKHLLDQVQAEGVDAHGVGPGDGHQRLEDLIHELLRLRLCHFHLEEEHEVLHAAPGDGEEVAHRDARVPAGAEVGNTVADGRLKLDNQGGRETAGNNTVGLLPLEQSERRVGHGGLEGRHRGLDRVAVAVQDVLGLCDGLDKHLLDVVGPDHGRTQFGPAAGEGRGRADRSGIVQLEATHQAARRQHRALGHLERDDSRGRRRHLHDHLHDLDLGIRGVGRNVSPVIDQVADELARGEALELGRVILRGEHAGARADQKARAAGLLLGMHDVRRSIQLDEQTAVVEFPDDDVDRRAVEPEHQVLRAGALDLDGVLLVINNERFHRGVHGDPRRRQLALLEIAEVLDLLLVEALHGPDGRAADHRQVPRGPLRRLLVGDPLVEPSRVVHVADKVLRLDEVADVVRVGADLAPDLELLQGDDHRPDGRVPRLRLGEQVAELRVGELVHSTPALDREVSPDVGVVLERNLLDASGGRLEPVVGVFGRDPHSNDVSGGGQARLGILKVDRVRALGVLAVEAPQVGDGVQRHPLRDQHLARRDVDPGDPLGDRMLDLQTRVELQKAVPVLLH